MWCVWSVLTITIRSHIQSLIVYITKPGQCWPSNTLLFIYESTYVCVSAFCFCLQKIEVTSKSLVELLSRTTEYLQPNPGTSVLLQKAWFVPELTSFPSLSLLTSSSFAGQAQHAEHGVEGARAGEDQWIPSDRNPAGRVHAPLRPWTGTGLSFWYSFYHPQNNVNIRLNALSSRSRDASLRELMFLGLLSKPAECWCSRGHRPKHVLLLLSPRVRSGGHGRGLEGHGRREGCSRRRRQAKFPRPPAECTGQGPQRNHSTLQLSASTPRGIWLADGFMGWKNYSLKNPTNPRICSYIHF